LAYVKTSLKKALHVKTIPYQSSSTSDPLSQPSSYASASSARELLSVSRSVIATDLLTMSRKLLIQNATDVSVDKDVSTPTEVGGCPACENMCGKLSRIGNGKRVLNLQVRGVNDAEKLHR
jgi:hypothetical protein